ncbi:hypothetical protein RIF29_08750 [Crotalaria pallida]|uniref:Uncharacterized protein n=1 Tax=Crotalaria pallida TaxID=3830 RepID=A0AAN9FR45_CROPI
MCSNSSGLFGFVHMLSFNFLSDCCNLPVQYLIPVKQFSRQRKSGWCFKIPVKQFSSSLVAKDMKLLSVCEAGFLRALAFSSASFDAIKPYEKFCTFDVPWLYLKVFFSRCKGKVDGVAWDHFGFHCFLYDEKAGYEGIIAKIIDLKMNELEEKQSEQVLVE